MEQKALKFIAYGHIAAGLMLAGLYFLTPLHRIVLELVYLSVPAIPHDETQTLFWIAILGPTIASWGVLFLAMVRQYFLTPSASLWSSMITAIAIWAPLDSTLCVINGIYLGAAGNAVVTVILIALLFRVRHLI